MALPDLLKLDAPVRDQIGKAVSAEIETLRTGLEHSGDHDASNRIRGEIIFARKILKALEPPRVVDPRNITAGY